MEPVKKSAFLLTGTIQPNNMILTELTDPLVRKNQYMQSIRFWVENFTFPVVFVDNSSTDISAYFEKEIAGGRLEILTFEGNDYPRELGKGPGELSCLLYAGANSKILAGIDLIYKVTGRLQILNMHMFTDRLQNLDFDVSADLSYNLRFADSRLFVYRSSFLIDYLAALRSELNDSKNKYFENALATGIVQLIKNGGVFIPFNTRPRFVGVSASINKSYHSPFIIWTFRNIIKKVKYGLVLRRVRSIKQAGTHEQ